MTTQKTLEPSLIGLLAKALPGLEGAKKNKANPAFKSRYADLAAVIEALAPISEYGLWFRQVPVQIDGGIGIETFYVHESGEEMSAGITPVPVNKNDAQGLGSAMSYGRRYGLMTAFGLSAEDDDGNAASRPTKQDKANDGPRISDEQYARLQQLIPAAKITPAQFNQRYGCKTVAELLSSQFAEAEGALNDRIAELAKAESNREAANV